MHFVLSYIQGYIYTQIELKLQKPLFRIYIYIYKGPTDIITKKWIKSPVLQLASSISK